MEKRKRAIFYKISLQGLIVFSLLILMFCLTGCNRVPNSHEDRFEIFSLKYIAAIGGTLRCENNVNTSKTYSLLVDYGEDADKIIAVPDKGYYFVKWSDGVTEFARQDKKVKSNLEFTAEFAAITDGIDVTYSTKGNGTIRGVKNQTIQRGTEAQPVEAVLYGGASQGEIFVRWSDGQTNPIRQDVHIVESVEITAEFGYTVKYAATDNGYIVGNAEQSIVWADAAESVTAMPNKGYRFVEWSDGVKTATRQDKLVTKSIDVYAVFEWRDADTFVYNYNYATGNYYEDGFTLTRGNVAGKTAVVPMRDYFTFDGWYLDENLTEKAFDANGNNILGEEIFNSPSRDLYAKWDVKEECIATYKILMVYVTTIDGTFVGNDGSLLDIRYRMDAALKQQCIAVTKRLRETLNDMLDGLVNFEVQSYFTTQPVDETCFINEKNDTCIYANQIPELINSGVLENYRSVVTLYSFGGEENLFTNWSGTGGKKYATVPMDQDIKHYGTLEQAMGEYNGTIGTCIHEFIHTIQFGIPCYDYHRAYHPAIPSRELDKLYLLNQFPVDFYEKLSEDQSLWEIENFVDAWRNSDKAGIPYGYWTNEIFDVIIKPECINGRPDGFGGVGAIDYGGSVLFWSEDYTQSDFWRLLDSDLQFGQRVPKGSRTTILTVKPKTGYKFIGWSDGMQDMVRILTDVQENITLIAYFERLSYTVEYMAGEGGKVVGDLEQTVLVGDLTTWVQAVPDEGYRFVGWSDGNQGYFNSEKMDVRQDMIGSNVYDENGELYERLSFSVIALFEKIE